MHLLFARTTGWEAILVIRVNRYPRIGEHLDKLKGTLGIHGTALGQKQFYLFNRFKKYLIVFYHPRAIDGEAIHNMRKEGLCGPLAETSPNWRAYSISDSNHCVEIIYINFAFYDSPGLVLN